MSATEASIVLRDGTRLLDGVTVDIRGGEVIAIVGPSGSGKTTLFETLAGLRRLTSGRIDVDQRWPRDTCPRTTSCI